MTSIPRLLGKADTAQRRMRRWIYQRVRPRDVSTPVFIVGSQRSGTSMTMRVFDLSLDAMVYHTTDHRAYRDGILHEDARIQRLVQRSRSAVTVFKPMNQIQRLPRYLSLLPDLRVVWLLRDYRDAVNSCVRRWDTMRDVLKQITIDPAQAGWHGEALPESLHEVVCRHYDDAMSLESANALFWYLRNQFFFELSLDQDPAVRVFPYEELVRRPDAAFARMFEFCGCPFDARLTREVTASSIGRYLPPELDSEIARLCMELTDRFGPLVQDAPTGS
jgi:hypothetical protein